MFKVEWFARLLFSMLLLNFTKVSFKINSYLTFPKNRTSKTSKKLIFTSKIFLRVESSILWGKEAITNRPDFKGIETLRFRLLFGSHQKNYK